MESLLHRYRNITVLFVAIIAQIAGVAYQVRRDNDVPLLRIWAVSAVTPVASAIENLRSGTFGVFTDFFSAHGSRDQSRASEDGARPAASGESASEERTGGGAAGRTVGRL